MICTDFGDPEFVLKVIILEYLRYQWMDFYLVCIDISFGQALTLILVGLSYIQGHWRA